MKSPNVMEVPGTITIVQVREGLGRKDRERVGSGNESFEALSPGQGSQLSGRFKYSEPQDHR